MKQTQNKKNWFVTKITLFYLTLGAFLLGALTWPRQSDAFVSKSQLPTDPVGVPVVFVSYSTWNQKNHFSKKDQAQNLN